MASGSGSGSGAGIPITLYFTCITVSEHENATWVNLTSTGAVNITYDLGTIYMSSVEMSITSENFTVLLKCSSDDSQQFSTVTITSGKQLLHNIIVIIENRGRQNFNHIKINLSLRHNSGGAKPFQGGKCPLSPPRKSCICIEFIWSTTGFSPIIVGTME